MCPQLDEKNNVVTTTTTTPAPGYAETTAVMTPAPAEYVALTTAAPFYCPHRWISYYPYPSDCSMFYECSFGTSTLRSCPNNWNFDGRSQSCKESSLAECFYVEPTTTAAPTTPTTPLPFQCPSADELSLEPHPYDCSSFVQCSYGVMEVRNCPSNWWFDMKLRLCVEPHLAQCLVTSTTTVAPPVTTPSICPPGLLSVEPHPTDCTQYYNCVYGWSTPKSCPTDQLFDGKSRTCKEANQAQCFAEQEVINH